MAGKILVVSDSHGHNANLRKVIEYFGPRGEQLEMLIHLGDMGSLESIEKLVDCPVEAVCGNCDFLPNLPAAKIITIGNEKALITHGHRYNCKSGTGLLRELAQENGAGIVLYGHTHMPLYENSDGIRIANPGSISMPRQMGCRPTYLVITIEEDEHLEFSIVTMQ
jgi:hypothetical protein